MVLVVCNDKSSLAAFNGAKQPKEELKLEVEAEKGRESVGVQVQGEPILV